VSPGPGSVPGDRRPGGDVRPDEAGADDFTWQPPPQQPPGGGSSGR
jgi:hypothetical protein